MTDISYDRPPITEAVIQLIFSSSLNSSELDDVKKYVKKNYNDETVLEDIEFNVNISSTNVKRNTEQYSRLSSSDMTQLCLLKQKSFTISQLAPYTSWGEFIARFERDYNIHKKYAGYKEIQRIGVRYINRIDIPLIDKIINEDEYLNIYPKYPNSMGVLSGYAIQQRSYIESLKSSLTINSAVVPSPLIDHGSIVFDQDIAREIELPQKIEDIISFLNSVRVEKNKIFEACITEKTRGLFRK